LADRPRYVRSGVRPWPLRDEQPGLHISDVDGDGRILTMRIPDETGHWMPHPEHPRLMVPRPLEGGGGPAYRLLAEGHLVGYDGDIVKVAPELAGLDFNRNFPYDWQPHADQEGAGDYPASEPEIRAAVQAIVDRPNIAMAVSYHTFGAVHLRPYGARPDEDFPPSDLRGHTRVSAEATRRTGYVDWYPFDHPQLGPVEIGGWDEMYALGNVPLGRLEAEVAPHSDWAVFLALVTPRLEVRSLTSEPVGNGAHRIRLVVQNTGW